MTIVIRGFFLDDIRTTRLSKLTKSCRVHKTTLFSWSVWSTK